MFAVLESAALTGRSLTVYVQEPPDWKSIVPSIDEAFALPIPAEAELSVCRQSIPATGDAPVQAESTGNATSCSHHRNCPCPSKHIGRCETRVCDIYAKSETIRWMGPVKPILMDPCHPVAGTALAPDHPVVGIPREQANPRPIDFSSICSNSICEEIQEAEG
jgi:hypothetical protein